MAMLVELNHLLEDGMMPYPGLPGPRIGAILDHERSRPNYDDKAEFYLGKVDMACNTGTYLDSPFHRYPEGADLSTIALEMVAAVPGLVLEGIVSSDRSTLIDCDESDLRGKAVLIKTGWDQRWGSEGYWDRGPYLAGESVNILLRAEAALLGVDFYNVDDTTDPARPAHARLLAAGILIVENLCNLAALPPVGFNFYAAPPRIVRGASFPVRAFAEVEL